MNKILFIFSTCFVFLAEMASAENLLPNSSFELGTASWGIRTVIPKTDGNYQVIREEIVSVPSAPHGTSVLSLPNPKGYHVHLCSARIPLEPGRYVFSISMKASKEFPVELQYFSPEKNSWLCPTKKVTVSKEWKRFEFSATIPKGHSKTVVRVLFHTPGTLFLDAVALERGERTSVYAPAAETEAALVMSKTWTITGKRNVEFLAVNYTGKDRKETFQLNARNSFTGWNLNFPQMINLPSGKTIRKSIEIPLENRGPVQLEGKWSAGTVIPFRVTVLNPLPSGKFYPETGFCIGVNETGVFRNSGENHNPYQGLGSDFLEHLDMLHASGISLVRLFEHELARSWFVNPERGKFDFTETNAYLNAFEKSSLIPVLCLDTDAFSYNPNSKRPRDLLKNKWFMVAEGKKGTPNPLKSISVSPKMSDWTSYLEAYIKNGRGHIRYYEILNEPNLRLPDAASYVSYLKEAYKTAKKVDPSCRIIGICATEDFNANGESYIQECASLDGFHFLDAVSFHPYQAALDTSEIQADKLLGDLKKIREKSRPGVPLWNTELFYIHSIRDSQKYRKTNPNFLPPQNLVRRFLIDLGEGIQVSTPLHVWQLFEYSQAVEAADPSWFAQKPILNAAAAMQNAFVYFLRGATSYGKIRLPTGLNGYRYLQSNGKKIAAFWAQDEQRKFKVVVPSPLLVRDSFGNPLGREFLLSEFPVYVTGENLDKILDKIVFLPQVEVEITGARFRESSVLAVEFRNHTHTSRLIQARIRGEAQIQKFTLPPFSEKTIPFRTEKSSPELLFLDGELHYRKILLPIPLRKTMKPGDTERVGNALTFRIEADSSILVITASIKDTERGERVRNQPWTGDCLEVFIDTKPESGLDRASLGDSVYRLFISPSSSNGLPQELTGSPNLEVSKIKYSLKDTGSDYSCRIEIPWIALGLKKTSDLGIDLISNHTEKKKRIAYYAWAGNDQNCFSRFQFGRLLIPSSMKE